MKGVADELCARITRVKMVSGCCGQKGPKGIMGVVLVKEKEGRTQSFHGGFTRALSSAFATGVTT